MGTKVTFRPLYGARDGHQALSYLLEIDDLTLLLDCGWTEDYDLQLLRPLLQVMASDGMHLLETAMLSSGQLIACLSEADAYCLA